MRLRLKPREVGLEQRHQRVFVEKLLHRVHHVAQPRVKPDAVERAQRAEGLRGAARAGFKSRVQRVVVPAAVVRDFRKELKPQQAAEQRVTFRAVVSPHRRESLPNACLAARRHQNARRRFRLVVIRDGAVPCVYAARKEGIRRKPRVLGEQVARQRAVLRVIIPIDEVDVLRRGGDDGLAERAARRIRRGAARLRHVEIHVAPHHRVQAVLFEDVADPRQMLLHQLALGYIAVPVHVFAAPQPVGLVHADVDAPRRKRSARGDDHLLDQRIRLFLAQKQHVVRVAHVLHTGPAERARHVSQRLDAGNHLNAQRVGVLIQLTQLRLRKAPAQVAEIRPARHLVGILGVEQHRVVAHAAQPAQEGLRGLHRRNGVSGAIQHRAEQVERGRFPHVEGALVKPRGEHRQPAEKFGAAPAENRAALRLRQHFQRPFSNRHGDGETVFRERQVQIGRLRPRSFHDVGDIARQANGWHWKTSSFGE